MSDFMFKFSILVFVLAGIQAVTFITASALHHRKWKHRRVPVLTSLPLVSVVVPCYNEVLTMANCVDSLLKQDYHNFEILLIDDGSSDATGATAENIAAAHPGKVRAFSKLNGGKATALNLGTIHAKGDIVISMDADSLFLPDVLSHLVSTFLADPSADAVAGNVKVVNRRGWWGRSQAVEYIYGQMILRRSFAQMGCMQVISGAIGAFRREALEAIGGYSSDTLVEDMDLTISLARAGKKVVFNPYAIAYTEAPESWRQLAWQRYRWVLGGLQTMIKHRAVFGEWSRIGLIGLPIFALYPWFAVAISLTWFLAIGLVISGAGMALAYLFIATNIVQMAFTYYAIKLDSHEQKRLIWTVWYDAIIYFRFLSFIVVAAGAGFVLNRRGVWAQERLGRNVIEESQYADAGVRCGVPPASQTGVLLG